ncbi:uncharacterized protein LOC129750950 [Uranotaenia lowii]|uniref:uncharacterized protein LOC129750950 n=1 Tax=Uranotaenia lowii TaxID=190385 RepID=UPI002479E0C3|nr:uncharacterized protein LOC129750950 [Uranotaenia lowii]
MISKKTFCFFLCSTVFIQQQNCSPVPTNRKIRHDMRRNSVDQGDDASSSTTSSDSSVQSKTTPSSRSNSASSESSSPQYAAFSTTALPIVSSTANDVVKLADIFNQPEPTKMDKIVKRNIVEADISDTLGRTRLLDNESHRENADDDMEVAETHLFRPLFKYKVVKEERRHIRNTVTSTSPKPGRN